MYPIEQLVARGGGEMGSGGGQFVLARDQFNPDGPLVRCRITRTYQRTAYHLQVLTVRDAAGIEQTIRVTDEHPFYVQFAGWTPANSLAAGDTIFGADGTLTVVSNSGEAHPHGVAVYNLEVDAAHTYFVLAEGADRAAAVWVHNANYAGRSGKQSKLRGLANDERLSSADRGWIQQELNAIDAGKRGTIRVPPGKQLAHRRGFAAKDGFSYQFSDLQGTDLHRLQHQFEGY